MAEKLAGVAKRAEEAPRVEEALLAVRLAVVAKLEDSRVCQRSSQCPVVLPGRDSSSFVVRRS